MMRLFACAVAREANISGFSRQTPESVVSAAEQMADGLATCNGDTYILWQSDADTVPGQLMEYLGAKLVPKNVVLQWLYRCIAPTNATYSLPFIPADAYELALDAYWSRVEKQPCELCRGLGKVDTFDRDELGKRYVKLGVACIACRGTRVKPFGHLDPVKLSVLADCLEEVGIDASHLRDTRRHYRGCHLVDAALGRT